MAKGIKVGKGNSTQIDVAANPQQVAIPRSAVTGTTETVYIGGVGGNPNVVNTLTIKVYYKDAAGTAYSNGYIDSQRGRKQFNVTSTSTTTMTRATLVAVSATSALSAGQMAISATTPSGTQFYASRITNKFVWQTDTQRYRYAVVSGGTFSYVDSATSATTYAVVEGV